jgi:hypothetical protein
VDDEGYAMAREAFVMSWRRDSESMRRIGAIKVVAQPLALCGAVHQILAIQLAATDQLARRWLVDGRIGF